MVIAVLGVRYRRIDCNNAAARLGLLADAVEVDAGLLPKSAGKVAQYLRVEFLTA